MMSMMAHAGLSGSGGGIGAVSSDPGSLRTSIEEGVDWAMPKCVRVARLKREKNYQLKTVARIKACIAILIIVKITF